MSLCCQKPWLLAVLCVFVFFVRFRVFRGFSWGFRGVFVGFRVCSAKTARKTRINTRKTTKNTKIPKYKKNTTFYKTRPHETHEIVQFRVKSAPKAWKLYLIVKTPIASMKITSWSVKPWKVPHHGRENPFGREKCRTMGVKTHLAVEMANGRGNVKWLVSFFFVYESGLYLKKVNEWLPRCVCVWESFVCEKVLCVTKLCVWQSCVCKRWCVTKLCVCVAKLCVCDNAVWKMVCDKVVWERCCVCVWQCCVWKMVCDKNVPVCVCERWCVCVWQSFAGKLCVTMLCVKDGVWQSCVWKMVCDKAMLCVEGSVWQSCAWKMVCVCVWQSCVWQSARGGGGQGGGGGGGRGRDTEPKTKTPHKDVGNNFRIASHSPLSGQQTQAFAVELVPGILQHSVGVNLKLCNRVFRNCRPTRNQILEPLPRLEDPPASGVAAIAAY